MKKESLRRQIIGKGVVAIMKKYRLIFMAILFCIIAAENREAQAYSVTLKKDGMYAEVLPEMIVDNSAAIFEKSVKRAMKYYEKYKDAGAYTLATEVPDRYRDFMSVAKKIKDSDEIIIRNPFYIYNPAGAGDVYHYYFVAERNREKLCLFSINIDSYTGKCSFWYDKSMDSYFRYDKKQMKRSLFYEINNITYALTPKETTVVRDQTVPGEHLILGDSKALEEQFKRKDYKGKKDEIFMCLAKIKEGRMIEKIEENIELELGEEFVKSEKKTKKADNKKGVYAGMIALSLIVIAVIGIFVKKRKKKIEGDFGENI